MRDEFTRSSGRYARNCGIIPRTLFSLAFSLVYGYRLRDGASDKTESEGLFSIQTKSPDNSVVSWMRSFFMKTLSNHAKNVVGRELESHKQDPDGAIELESRIGVGLRPVLGTLDFLLEPLETRLTSELLGDLAHPIATT